MFLACSGRILEFYYNPNDFYIPKLHGTDQGWNLSPDHPFLISTLLCFCASTLITPVGYVKIYRLVDKPKSKCAGPKTKPQLPQREMGFRTLGLKSVGFLWQIEVHQYGVGRQANFSCFADQKIHTGCLTLESVSKP